MLRSICKSAAQQFVLKRSLSTTTAKSGIAGNPTGEYTFQENAAEVRTNLAPTYMLSHFKLCSTTFTDQSRVP